MCINGRENAGRQTTAASHSRQRRRPSDGASARDMFGRLAFQALQSIQSRANYSGGQRCMQARKKGPHIEGDGSAWDSCCSLDISNNLENHLITWFGLRNDVAAVILLPTAWHDEQTSLALCLRTMPNPNPKSSSTSKHL